MSKNSAYLETASVSLTFILRADPNGLDPLTFILRADPNGLDLVYPVKQFVTYGTGGRRQIRNCP